MSYPFSDQFEFMDESQQQHQQLSPVTGYPQWEAIERGDQQQQQQHHIESPLDSTTPTGPTPVAFRTINLEMDDMPHNIMPSTTHIDNTPIILHNPHALHQQLHLQQQQHQQFHQQQQQQYQQQQSRHPSVEPFSTQISRPGSSSQHHADAFRPQSATPNPATESGPSTSNTTTTEGGGRNTSRKSSGPIRSSGRVTRAQQQAPYFRPSPASTTASFLGLEVPRAAPGGGSGSSASSTPRLPQQPELQPQPRKQNVRFTAAVTPGPIRTRAASRAAASSTMASPAQSGSPTTSQVPELSGSAATSVFIFGLIR